MNAESKVTPVHLQRAAYLYIRQSTLRQVLENTESTHRQYALRRRAVALGWLEERIVVIDHDLGKSGASTVQREGFQQLVAEVGLGKAGIVMGLEVSRLARNCADWHRLLEICALTHTLILDEDGLYDPGHYNDRLLLGLKGTMSEAELHVLKARLVGGILNKAQRGELKMPLPAGLVYDESQRVCLDPDQQVQQSLRHFFATFRRTGSAWATVQAFRRESLKFPKRGQAGSGEIAWQELTHAVALETLHNPRYAGAFCFGRTRTWKDIDGKEHCRQLPREQWRFLKKDAHPGYICWEEFLDHERRLLRNQQAHGAGERKAGPAREGPALLQGLVLCGKCGRAMSLRYHQRGGRLTPDYVCAKDCVERARPLCQCIPGGGIDEAVGSLLVESVTPLALEVALKVQDELQARLAEADRLRHQHVQRTQYEAEQARLRYMRVDPNNRLVADTLETQWNEKLRLLTQAKEEYEKQRQHDSAQISAEQRAKILALASDFPRLWNNPKTLDRDRKRMARLLLEDVTLRREQEVVVQVRFKGGATRQLQLPLPKRAWELKKTKPEIVAEINRLSDQHTDGEIARLLNQRDWRSGGGCLFTLRIVNRLRRDYHLKSLGDRLRAQGWLTVREIATVLECKSPLVNYWRKTGLLAGRRFCDRNDYLYQRPPELVVAEIKTRQKRQRWKTQNTEQLV
ncbi:MAG: recombinase family protein [Deltaproteobacteria bacterium]|nr:recombinase family protein [Deltaproteobacteria bacterium]